MEFFAIALLAPHNPMHAWLACCTSTQSHDSRVLQFFKKAIGVRVPRARFLPVKNTSDLLAVQSNLYEVKHGTLLPNSAREVAAPPVIKLGPEFTDLVRQVSIRRMTVAYNCRRKRPLLPAPAQSAQPSLA